VIKSFKMLMPFLIEQEDSKKIVFLNFEEGKSYFSLNFEQTDDVLNAEIFQEVFKEKKKNSPQIPEELTEVMNTEKDLTKDSARHIFRRN